ncbi:MAG: PilZ domain-containing protein [Acidobacteria bacterium]|nr:PilZ domain-containing protein [Acidobacteriota bacterium]
MAAKKVPPFGAKRSSERVPIHGTVHGDIMVFEPLLVREVSTSGASIETSFPMHINSLHDVRLTLGDISVILKGRVAHSHVSEVKQDVVTYRTGIEFVEPSPAVLGVLTSFLDELKANRSASRPTDEIRMRVGRLSSEIH